MFHTKYIINYKLGPPVSKEKWFCAFWTRQVGAQSTWNVVAVDNDWELCLSLKTYCISHQQPKFHCNGRQKKVNPTHLIIDLYCQCWLSRRTNQWVKGPGKVIDLNCLTYTGYGIVDLLLLNTIFTCSSHRNHCWKMNVDTNTITRLEYGYSKFWLLETQIWQLKFGIIFLHNCRLFLL